MYLTDDNRPAPSYEKLKAFVDSKIPPNAVFDIPQIEHEFVLKELQNIDHKKDIGTDGLSSKILQMIAPAVATSIVNFSTFVLVHHSFQPHGRLPEFALFSKMEGLLKMLITYP